MAKSTRCLRGDRQHHWKGFASEAVTNRARRRKLVGGTVAGLRIYHLERGTLAIGLNIIGEDHVRIIHFYKERELMTVYDYVISAEGRSLLMSLLGRKLKSIEGYRCDLVPVEGKTTFYAVARLHMEDGKSYDLRVRLVRVDIASDFWDDAGAYSFGRAEGEIWLPEGVEPFKLPIGRVIEGVLLTNDYDALMHDGRKEGEFTFTKAVLLRTSLEHIAFSMDDFSEDAIVVRRGFDPDALVPDGSGSWYDKPGWTDEYERKLEAL